MIQKMSHTIIHVLDQDVAKDFYVDKLGFEVKVDASLPNGFRWLTVAPKGQRTTLARRPRPFVDHSRLGD